MMLGNDVGVTYVGSDEGIIEGSRVGSVVGSEEGLWLGPLVGRLLG